MPERPDLEYAVPILREALVGRSIAAVRVGDPVVLRLAVAGGVDALVARRIVDVTRLGHTVRVHLDAEVDLAVHPMLAGRFSLQPGERAPTRDLVVSWALDDGRALWLRDDVRMAKVTVLPHGRWEAVPGLLPVGVDVLGPAFTREALRDLARRRRDQVKTFLLDKAALDSFGNAYADEALFAAGVHPKARVRELDDAALDRLRDAMVAVLTEARDQLAARRPALDEKLRDFLKVRNRKGQPCPRCGAPIRVAGVNGHDAFFCAVCQPDRAGRGLVDWRKAR